MVSDYLVVGGDARQTALARLLAAEADVCTLGVPGLPDRDGAAAEIVLPIPSVGPDGALRGLSWEALQARLGPVRRIWGGAFGRQRTAFAVLGVPATDLLDDPQTVAGNARLTAEAAVLLVQQQTGTSLFGQRCAVVGFGRIGQCLCSLLRALGAELTLLSAAAEKRALAEALGIPALPPEAAERAAPTLLFNTAPLQLLPERTLSSLPAQLLWVELASAPGGLPSGGQPFSVLPAGGLPGKLLPVSAAELLLRGIHRNR